METFLLNPPITATLQNDLENGPKKGDKVTLIRSSISGSLVKVEGRSNYDRISQFDSKTEAEVMKRANVARSDSAMFRPPVVRRRSIAHI